MKRIIQFSLFVATSAHVGIARADHQIGNGGDVVVCRDAHGQVVTAEILDFYERNAIRPDIDQQLGEENLGVDDKVALALERFARVDPRRSSEYLEAAAAFAGNIQWSSVALTDIHDEGLNIRPSCPIEQLVIQQNPLAPNDGRYVIDQSLWNILSNDQKAGMILHEIVYRDALMRGHTDSFFARYFNTLIVSGRFAAMTDDEYRMIVQRIELDIVKWTYNNAGGTLVLYPTPMPRARDAQAICDQSGYRLATRKEVAAISGFAYSPIANVLLDEAETARFWFRDGMITDYLVGFFERDPRAFKFEFSSPKPPYTLCQHN